MSSPTSALNSRAAVWSVMTMFAVNGLVIGSYAASLPTLRANLGLDGLQVPILLFVVGALAILSMQVGGRLADRIGARPVALTAMPILAIGSLLFGTATNYPLALLAAVLLGLGNGAMDVAMNAYGVRVEQARTSPIMSFFHAMWSVGTLSGSGLTVVVGHLAAGRSALAMLMCTTAAVALASFLLLRRWAPPTPPVRHDTDSGGPVRVPVTAWLLGIAAICFGLAEGTAYDWSAIHVTDVARVEPSTGALGLTMVSAFMMVIRLLGDRLVARFGRRKVVRAGGLCAGLGYLIVGVLSGLPLLLVGWALVGLGVGMIAPQVYAVAGHLGGGRVLALVVTFGYATFLMGPAFTGFTISQLGIRHAMLIPGCLCASLLVLAVVLPGQDRDPSVAGAGQPS